MAIINLSMCLMQIGLTLYNSMIYLFIAVNLNQWLDCGGMGG